MTVSLERIPDDDPDDACSPTCAGHGGCDECLEPEPDEDDVARCTMCGDPIHPDDTSRLCEWCEPFADGVGNHLLPEPF